MSSSEEQRSTSCTRRNGAHRIPWTMQGESHLVKEKEIMSSLSLSLPKCDIVALSKNIRMDLLRFLVLLFFSFSFSKRGVVVFSFSKNLAKGDEFALPINSGEGSVYWGSQGPPPDH